MQRPIDITIVGGGMITNDLILPSIYHLQRLRVVDKVQICALQNAPLRSLLNNDEIRQAFPDQTFTAHPSLSEPPEKEFPDLYRSVLAAMPPRQLVVVALPDQLHYQVVKEALKHDQHVLCVKPLVLCYAHAREIEELAFEKGLFVGVEYHKRFDRRSLIAKRSYGLGHFGEFRIGEAKMIEPYYYRDSNFQNWFTTDKTDPFVYVGCHYVDLVHFITGILPVEVSVAGIEGQFPNGNRGYLWTHGRLRYENGAILSVIDGLGYPDDGAGSNEQCLSIFCEGQGKSGLIKHNDQFRGVRHAYLEGTGLGGTHFNYINPDFYRLVPWEGSGYKPVGYGYDSIAATVNTVYRMENEVAELSEKSSLAHRRKTIRATNEKGIVATPANSYVNELVVEAARLSITNNAKPVKILHGRLPHVSL